MNDEKTIIMQPKAKAEESAKKAKDNKPESNTVRMAAATAAAGVFGGAVGGASSVAAANFIHDIEQEEIETPAEEELIAEATPAPAAKAEEEIAIVAEEEADYTNNNGANPVVEEPEAIAASDTTSSNEVQVLGVYERTTEDGTYQEMAIMTNGEEYAVILDADGDGEADVLGVDMNHNGELDEGEICDISDQHVSMTVYEQEYLAQQQMEMEMEQQDTFAYEASDETDYDNDVDFYEA